MAKLRYRYVTPVYASGARVECEVRGLVQIVGLSDGPLPWPIGELNGVRELIVYRGLAKALIVESPDAIAEMWGVPVTTARRWQTALAAVPERERWRRQQTTIAKHKTPTPLDRVRQTGNVGAKRGRRVN